MRVQLRLIKFQPMTRIRQGAIAFSLSGRIRGGQPHDDFTGVRAKVITSGFGVETFAEGRTQIIPTAYPPEIDGHEMIPVRRFTSLESATRCDITNPSSAHISNFATSSTEPQYTNGNSTPQ